MKHLLLTTIAAVMLVGCGESQSPAKAPDISIHGADHCTKHQSRQTALGGWHGCGGEGGGTHSFAQFYRLVSHGAHDTTSPGTKTVSCENSWHERGICLTNRLGCVNSGSCGKFSPEQIIREHGSENKLPTAQPLLGGP